MKITVKRSKVCASSNNYAGAYDLEGEGFSTKDDLVQFDDAVIDILQECYPDTFRIDDSYIEDNVIYLSVQSSEGNWAEGSVKVDMRRIKKPSDILKYSNAMVDNLKKELDTVYVSSSTSVNIQSSKDIAAEILDKVTTKLLAVMTSDEFGFDYSEAKEYSHVDVTPTDEGFKVEVGAEVSYDGMITISQELDKVVSEYDPDAYFDMEDPGLMSAYICTNSSIRGALDANNLPGPGDHNPPEGSDEVVDYDDVEDEVIIDLDANVYVDDDGDWDYEDTNYPWAQSDSNPRGDWYSSEMNTYLGGATDMVEHVDDLMMDKMPTQPGKYHISGKAYLHFIITNINADRTYYEDGSYDDFVYTDDAKAEWDKNGSEIKDFRYEMLE